MARPRGPELAPEGDERLRDLAWRWWTPVTDPDTPQLRAGLRAALEDEMAAILGRRPTLDEITELRFAHLRPEDRERLGVTPTDLREARDG